MRKREVVRGTTRRLVLIPVMAMGLLSLTPDAQAQRNRGGNGTIVIGGSVNFNKGWQDQYIGRRNFNLSDDPMMSSHIAQVNRSQRTFNQAKKNADAQATVVSNLTSKRDKITKEIADLGRAITQGINKKTKLTNEKNTLTSSLPGLQNQIDLAKASVQGAQNAVNTAKNQLSRAQNKLSQAQSACSAAPTPACQAKVQRLKQNVAQKKSALTSAENLLSSAKSDLQKKRAAKKKAEQRISTITTKIAQIENENATRATKVNTLTAQLKNVKQKLKGAKNQLATLRAAQQNARAALNRDQSAKDQYKARLVRRILEVNALGASNGRESGKLDGIDLASYLGSTEGNSHGTTDGHRAGTNDGMARDYNTGYQSGLVDGARRAQVEGETNGANDGTVAGNIQAAKEEGHVAGVNRANSSDADQVGTAQGKEAGMQRAIQTGNRVGTKQGEQNAIKAYESINLKVIKANGNFAGAFSGSVPSFPDGHRGRRFEPNAHFRRHVVKMAYRDGFVALYRQAVRRTYNRNIEGIYNRAYRDAHDVAYSDAFNRDYPDSRSNGYATGEREAYERDYQGHYNSAYRTAFNHYRLNPNRNSSEYTSTYTQVEASSYATRYEEIRAEFFARFEQSTFDDNIEAQTTKYRNLRFAAVSDIYEKNPVLAYESSDMIDGGIKGVAAKDGIFQPGETTFHNIVVANYGKQAANNAKVMLNDGVTYKLPSIAPQSKVIILGAAKGSVLRGNNQMETKSLSVASPLTAEAKIQGRHYDNAAAGLVTENDNKRFQVKYPLSIANLNLESVLIKDRETALSLQLNNSSSRPYTGPLKVVLTTDANSEIITKDFPAVNSLNSSARVQGASITVSDLADVYSPLAISAKVYKNGVLLGQMGRRLSMMAKMPFVNKIGAPVLAFNSDSGTRSLLAAIDRLGGVEKLSLLDTSLSSLNRAVIGDGLRAKDIIMLPEGAKRALDSMLAKSQNSALYLLSDYTRGISEVKSLSTFNKAEITTFKIPGMTSTIQMSFSNPDLSSAKKSIAAMGVSLDDLNAAMEIGSILKLDNPKIVEKVRAELNGENYFSSNHATKVLMAGSIIRAIDENMRINREYLEKDKDSKIADKVRSNDDLLHNLLADKVGRARESNIGAYIFASELKASLEIALKKHDPIEDIMTTKVNNRIFGALFVKGALKPYSKIAKSLKKIDEVVAKKVSKVAGTHVPLALED